MAQRAALRVGLRRLALLSSSVRRHRRQRLMLVAGVCICSRQSNFKVNLL